MQTVNASVILEDAQRLFGWGELSLLEATQRQQARTAFSLALQEVWDAWWWEELMQCEAIPAAKFYKAATAFAVGDFCYYPASRKFYQALQATTGNPPAILQADGGYLVNPAFWAEAVAVPNAGDFTPGAIYRAGDQVRDPADGQFYQCIGSTAGIVVVGAGMAIVNGKYTATGTFGGKPEYTRGDYSGICIRWAGPNGYTTQWYIGAVTPGGAYFVPAYLAAESTDTPDLAATWRSSGMDGWEDSSNDPAPQVLSAGANPSLNPYCWAVLKPFTPEIQAAGTIRAISAFDPRNSDNGGLVPFEQTLTGFRLPGWTEGVPWVWYRRTTPIITGDDFNATVTYSAAPQLTFT